MPLPAQPSDENAPDPTRVMESSPIPVLRPILPSADRLLPYLRRIDASRTYSNWGPLVGELEGRLQGHFGLAPGGVVTSSSGTTALVGAILASAGRAGRDRPLALLPAFTFVATVIAVEACGYQPYLVDVDPHTWLLQAEHLRSHRLLERVGLVVPVAAFGRAIEQEPWLDLQGRSGVPVVIDGAASFDALSAEPRRFIGAIPVAMSFHATKTFATGEGGGVVATDTQLARLVTQALNFGFYASRDSRTASTNGKMSEYHAAVGLAELDGWAAKRSAFRDVAEQYRRHMTSAGLGEQCLTAPVVAACYVLFRCADAREAGAVQESLTRHQIEFRLWYGLGLHAQPHFADLPGQPLPVTDAIAPLIIGLPVAPDLTDSAVGRVVTAIASGIDGG